MIHPNKIPNCLPIFNTIRIPQFPIVTSRTTRIGKNNIAPKLKQSEVVLDDLIETLPIDRQMVLFHPKVANTLADKVIDQLADDNEAQPREGVSNRIGVTEEEVLFHPKVANTLADKVIDQLAGDNDVLAIMASEVNLDCPIQVDQEVVPEPTSKNIPTAPGPEKEFCPYFIDISLETCNPMSETYNTLRRCAVRGNMTYDRQYAIIGSLEGPHVATQFLPCALPEEHPYSIAATLMSNIGFKVIIGRWNLVGLPTAILIDVPSAYGILGYCKGLLRKDAGLHIEDGDFLANFGLVFGFLVGQFIATVGDIVEKQAADSIKKQPVLVHFHEWASALGLLYLKQANFCGGTTFYTSHQTPIDAFIKTAYDINWINHRTVIEKFCQLSASLYLPAIPEEGKDLDQVYWKAYEKECGLQRTWHFDVTYNINHTICQTILTHAASSKALQYEGRHVIIIPFEAQWESSLDLVDYKTIQGPIGHAIHAMKFRNHEILVGRLRIPSSPLVLLFKTVAAKEQVYERLKFELRRWMTPESVLAICTFENVFKYLTTAFFSSYNHETDRQEMETGVSSFKVIRQYDFMDDQ